MATHNKRIEPTRSRKPLKTVQVPFEKVEIEEASRSIKTCELNTPLQSAVTTVSSLSATAASSPTDIQGTRTFHTPAPGNTVKLKVHPIAVMQEKKPVCERGTMTEQAVKPRQGHLADLVKEIKKYKVQTGKKLNRLSQTIESCESDVQNLARTVARLSETPSNESIRASVDLLACKVDYLQNTQKKTVKMTSKMCMELEDCRSLIRGCATPNSVKSPLSSTPVSLPHTPQAPSTYTTAMRTLQELQASAERTLATSIALRRLTRAT